MKNYKLHIQYDGTRYNGWQKQTNTDNTITTKLESILSDILHQSISLHGSGRTDAGVHANGQIANFHFHKNINYIDLQNQLNCLLPEDIVVNAITEVPLSFHSRLSALSKTYIYKIDTQSPPSVFQRKYSYSLQKPLRIDLMKTAAILCCGEHDFISFSSLKPSSKSTIRTIYSIDIYDNDSIIEIHYTGDGFLYNMVRILTGTLIEVGLEHISPNTIPDIIKARNRQLAGPTAPPQGLFLDSVIY